MFLLFNFALAYIVNECQNSGVVAITFDDGPNKFTQSLSKKAKELGVHVTFHINTSMLNDEAKEAIKAIKKDGNGIGLRTNSRRDYYSVKDKDIIESDLKRQCDALKSITKSEVKLARSPIKNNSPQPDVTRFFTDKKIIQTVPTFCPFDVNGNPVKAVEDYFNTINKDFDSAIINLYDGEMAKKNLLEKIVKIIKSNGFKIVPLSECVGKYGSSKGKNMSYNTGKKESGIDSYIITAWIFTMPYLMF